MTIDTTTTTFFHIPPYIFFAGIGFVISICVFIISLVIKRVTIDKFVIRLFVSLIFLVLCAKLFGIILNIITAIYTQQPITKEVILNAGIVYYGGLIGFISSFILICKIKDKEIDKNALDSLAIAIPIFHAFGRIGCFFAGCCYGITCNNSLAVSYTNIVDGTIVTANRLPIQLIEATENIIIFIVLCVLSKLFKKKGLILPIYLLIYSVVRFINESLRSDWNRAMFGGISLSQIISMIILIISITVLIINSKSKEKYTDGEVF